jgi:AraC-like DNA-binding protein
MIRLKKEIPSQTSPQDFELLKFDELHSCEFQILHFHDFWELVYCDYGSGDILVEGYTKSFSNGLLALVPPEKLHRINYLKGLKGKEYVLHLQKDFIEGLCTLGFSTKYVQSLFLKGQSGIWFNGFEVKKLSTVFDTIFGVEDLHKLPHIITLLIMLTEISDYQLMEISSHTKDGPEFQRKRFQKVLEVVENRYKEGITTEEVAKEVAMTTTSFCRFFKAFTNKSFKSFLNSFRVQEAKRLLINSDLSLAEIAFLSGFSSLSYFDRTFKKIDGLSPGMFRRKFSLVED